MASRPRNVAVEGVFSVLLSRLPFNRDAGRLAATCKSASQALRGHIAALRADLSGGAESSYGCPLSSTDLRGGGGPPLPLDFRYISERLALETDFPTDGGCTSSCCCFGDAHGAERPSSSQLEPKGAAAAGAAGSGSTAEDGAGEQRSSGCATPKGAPPAANAAGSSSTAGAGGAEQRGGGRATPEGGPAAAGRHSIATACGCGVIVPGGQPAYQPGTGGLALELRGHEAAAAQHHLLECGPACACTASTSAGQCPARLTQRGLAAAVTLRWQQGKGWGAFAAESIPAGRFVCCYIGEYCTTVDAQMRLRMYDQQGQGHALLVLREVLPSGLVLRTNIDATRLGNVARFFNHSCDGGSLELVVVRRRGSLLPAVALFAAHDISPAEELTFAYGPPTSGRAAAASGRPGEERQQQQQQLERPQQRCLCGSSACLGLMPNEA